MKLQALFKIKENQLETLEGKPFPIENAISIEASSCIGDKNITIKEGDLFFIDTPWSSIGKDESSYNEEFLAKLRDFLKKLEELKAFAFIDPKADSPVASQDEKEAYTASCKHCARRIKDCANLIGFSIPKEVDQDFFMEELRQKHAHYIFFTRENNKIILK